MAIVEEPQWTAWKAFLTTLFAGGVAPLFKGRVFNTAVAANTNIFATALSPTNTPTFFRIYACFNTAGILIVRRTRAAVTVSEQLNSGANLVANGAYMFDIVVESGETINLHYSVGATIISLKVVEVSGASV